MMTAGSAIRWSLVCAANRSRSFAFIALVIMSICGFCSERALADGGKLQISQRAGPWIVSFFTSPTPPTVGPVDVSVLVQQADTKENVTDVQVRLVAREKSGNFELERIATRDAATNKLFQAAWFDLPTAGAWVITANVTHEGKTADVTFDLSISDAPRLWSWFALWIAWPLLPIGAYASAQFRCARRKEALK